MSATESMDFSLRVGAALDYARLSEGENVRAHYVWLFKEMMATFADNGGVEALSTSALVATVVAWSSDHSRLVSGGQHAGGDAVVLRLVLADDAAASGNSTAGGVDSGQ